MTIESEIAGLTQATTDLLTAVNVRKATLDEKVTSATSSAASALESRNAAEAAQQDIHANWQAKLDSAASNASTAATAATQAANEAQSAATAVDLAFAEATAAQAARTGADAARDAALIQAGVFVDEPTGRAAVLDGQAFKVQGAGDVAAYEYRRVNAGTVSTLVATYPSATAVAMIDRTTQIEQAKVTFAKVYSAEVFNGAQFWNGTTTSGATSGAGGINIPAGSTGANSYIRFIFALSAEDRAKYAGRPLRFYVPIKTSPNFNGATGWSLAVQKNNLEATGVTPAFFQIDLTHWVFYWDITPVGTETQYSAYFQKWNTGALTEALQWWAEGLYMMPQDALGFRDAVQSNLDDVFSHVTTLEDWLDWGRYAEAWPKMELDRNNQGQIFSGAQWWNGSAVVGTNPGGLQIPAGSTGVDSYLAWQWPFSADDRTKYAGKKFRIVVALKTTADALDNLTGMFHAVDDNGGGTLGTVSNKKLYKASSTLYLLSADYVASGAEVQVRMYYQRTSGTAVGSNVGIYTVGHFVVPLEVQGFTTAVDFYTAKLSKYALDPIENVGNFKGYGEAFNGATLDTVAGRVDIPAGRTGENSYCVYKISIHGERLNAGDTIQLRLLLNTTANYTSIASLAYGVNGELNGAGFTSAQVAGTLVARQVSTTQIEITADYVVRGGVTEDVGLYAQSGGRTNTAQNLAFWPASVTYTKKDEAQNEEVLRRYLLDNRIDSGDLYDYTENSGEVFNGAVFQDSSRGVKIPMGSKGDQSYVGYKFPADSLKKFKDALVTVYVLLRTSADFTTESPLTGNLSVFTTASGLQQRSRRSSFQKLNSTTFLAAFEYWIQGDETHFRPYAQVTGSAVARTAEGFMTYAGLWVSFDALGGQATVPGSVPTSLADMALTYRKALGASATASSDFAYIKTITVKPDGTGNYTTLHAAIAAEGGGTGTNRRVLYQVYEGIYTDLNTWFPDFVDVVGIGKRDQIWFKGYLPADTALDTITATQTWYWNGTGRIRNVKVTAQNMRYPIHSDSGASGLKALQEIEDCHVEHLGNEEARAYRQSIGQDPNAVWGSEHAWGCGTHSGQHIVSRRTTWVSRTSTFYFHTNRDFAEANLIELDNSPVICTTASGNALVVQCLGSGTPDRLVINGSHVEGRLNFTPLPMLSQQAYNYRGNMNSEVEVFISASSPVAWQATNHANVLELRSMDAVGSSVVVSGSGADALFGVVPEYQYGGSGYAARVWSAHAISIYSGFAGLDLGTRLGDCTSVNKVLNIVFDGGAVTKTLTLNQNFTGQSNATIISTLNTLLNDGAGRAFSELNPYDGVAKVYQLDRELKLQNNSNTVVLKGQAVSFDGSRRLCRKAANADARVLVAGIALENIAPGRFGRVQKDGQFMTQQLRFSGATSLVFGDTFGVSAADGDLVEGAAVPLLRVIEAGSHPVYELI